MAAVVRWFKSGEVEITKFGPLKSRVDDSEGERITEAEGDQPETPEKPLHLHKEGNHNNTVTIHIRGMSDFTQSSLLTRLIISFLGVNCEVN